MTVSRFDIGSSRNQSPDRAGIAAGGGGMKPLITRQFVLCGRDLREPEMLLDTTVRYPNIGSCNKSCGCVADTEGNEQK